MTINQQEILDIVALFEAHAEEADVNRIAKAVIKVTEGESQGNVFIALCCALGTSICDCARDTDLPAYQIIAASALLVAKVIRQNADDEA